MAADKLRRGLARLIDSYTEGCLEPGEQLGFLLAFVTVIREKEKELLDVRKHICRYGRTVACTASLLLGIRCSTL